VPVTAGAKASRESVTQRGVAEAGYSSVMPPTQPANPPPGPLPLAQELFDAGRFAEALALLRPLQRRPLTLLELAQAESLHCRSAFRVGELAEAERVARALLARVDAGVEPALAARFDVMAVAVVACGELALFEDCLNHLRELLALSARIGDLAHWVRARGSAANCFCLLGDLWAGERVLAELAGAFMGPDLEMRLEFTVRSNHASVTLLIARQARSAGQLAEADEALVSAAASMERGAEIAARLQDRRLTAFAQVHALELALLRGEPPAAPEALQQMIHAAEDAGLRAHVRQLRLLQSELQLAAGETAAALHTLQQLQAGSNDGHELSSRIRLHQLLHRARRAAGELAAAELARDEAERLLAFRSFKQAQAQSRFVRLRLELEHLHRKR
jgi:hypothetical protein